MVSDRVYGPEIAARANGLMRAYLNGRLQAGLDWPEWDEYWDVYRQALRAAARGQVALDKQAEA